MHENWDLKYRKYMLLLLVVFWGGGVKSETQSEKAISEQLFFTAEYSIWCILDMDQYKRHQVLPQKQLVSSDVPPKLHSQEECTSLVYKQLAGQTQTQPWGCLSQGPL